MGGGGPTSSCAVFIDSVSLSVQEKFQNEPVSLLYDVTLLDNCALYGNVMQRMGSAELEKGRVAGWKTWSQKITGRLSDDVPSRATADTQEGKAEFVKRGLGKMSEMRHSKSTGHETNSRSTDIHRTAK